MAAEPFRLTVLGTTDLHGNVVNWDYYRSAEYDDPAHNDVGLAKIATLVREIRKDLSPRPLLLDAGDTIQGTPLAYYFARVEPITDGHEHPVATAMNLIGYDAAALGNHEFNYGLDVLRTFEQQLDFPLLGANAHDAATGEPVFPPYTLIPLTDDLTVGVLGLTNPGIAIWDKPIVEGRYTFGGIVEQAAYWVPRVRAAGADVVIVAAHSGMDLSSSYGDALPTPENASVLMAETVPGIDAVLVGHAHVEIPERLVTNVEGEQVVLSEPLKWGMRLSVISLDLAFVDDRWRVVGRSARVLNANTVEAAADVVEVLRKDHEKVVEYVNSKIGTCTEAMSAATATWEHTAALDFVNHVQTSAVVEALAGTPYADLPVLSIVAPFSRTAAIPAGDVSLRDVAGLYVFDNTLLAVLLTGAQVRDYLEFSARYFHQVSGMGPFHPSDLTNAPTGTAPTGTPDYNYDIAGGLTYTIDLARPAGSRITADLPPDQEYVVALNNYRQSGSGNFPHVTTAPVVHNPQTEIRQLLIDYVTAAGTIDPSTFRGGHWSLVSSGTPIVVAP